MKNRAKINCYNLFILFSDYHKAKYSILFNDSKAYILADKQLYGSFVYYLSFKKIKYHFENDYLVVNLEDINLSFPKIMKLLKKSNNENKK